ncbi:helix-turn-helix transcriptional regulator [Piscinibacter sakaiensis]|uniref:HTH cro/C1-type domain-containing protein n=1 Tax=Piscinibacter sakaiensis TaxID=1547922 RepID=A0A0K8P1X0_PISS1|nr:helix-turn-helix transcriptional regulator [Piscinibacter sakaiensis]GAP36549.1 hypothetical protein ISF6_2389 [Piscinibacter sakaiensis]
MSLGTKLSELRTRQRESLQAVATAVGISKTHVWQLEKGNSGNPSIELLKKLAEHFGVPLAYLADTEGDESLDDVEARQFLRDFRALGEEERGVLVGLMRVLKGRGRGRGNASGAGDEG